MGCDIHIYTEKKNSKGDWLCADFYEVNEYYDGTDGDEWEQEYSHIDFYKGRYYELFGALAGVRADEMNHIPPKGIPDDVSKECASDFKRWDSDAHTPSWLTLAELKAHQIALGGTVKRSGMINEEQAIELERGIKPSSWCGSTNLGGYVHASWEDDCNPLSHLMDQLNRFLSVKYYEYELKSMADSDFRIVFWFDN